jgi:methionyl-tRNA formyltransferase
MGPEGTYVVAASGGHAASLFLEQTRGFPGKWHLITCKEDLTLEVLERLSPDYVFFPHWSFIVPEEIVTRFPCVCFHCTDVPFGRGGSPVQNLIARGHRDTQLTALRMVRAIDEGPVYLKEPMSLGGGGDEIYLRIAKLAYEMMRRIIIDEPEPQPQEGEATVFARRTPEQSALPTGLEADLLGLFDHIRMLDAAGYPRAFVDVGPWRLELSRPALRNGEVHADVRIFRRVEDAE